jgi:glycosyltransferase involved in cell wall biosynthesis
MMPTWLWSDDAEHHLAQANAPALQPRSVELKLELELVIPAVPPPCLSICIATRNRGAFIAETLLSIASQNQTRIEILVLDGASSDNTPHVVTGLQEQIPYLRYVRRDSNGGVDRDYDEAVRLAVGRYCWLMSDDDILLPGAVAAVLEAIDAEYELIVVNSEVRNIDLTRSLDPNRLQRDMDKSYGPDELQQLFLDTSAYLGYIGAVVIRRETWLARDRASYFGSYFIHVGVIFQAPLPGHTLVIAQPLISVRFGNTQWRPKEFEIRMVRWTELVWSLPAISEQTCIQRYRREPWRSAASLFFYRAKGTYDFDQYRRWIRPRAASAWNRLTAFCIALFPGPLANVVGLLYCRQDYRDSNIHYLDMKASRFFPPTWLRNLIGADGA